MKRMFNQWRLIASISLIFPNIYCYAAQPVQSQLQMMAADNKPILKQNERKVESEPKPLPNEPLLFETKPNGIPSAMPRDQDIPTTYAHDAISAFKDSEKPRSMPPEPEAK